MRNTAHILIRSLLIYFPSLAVIKPTLQRFFFRLLRIPFEKELQALRLLQLQENDLLLDVGANEGFAIDAFLLLKKRFQIFAFEPRQDLSAGLVKRYKLISGIKIFPFGLGEANGEYALYTPVYRNFLFHPLSSFVKEHAESWLRHNEIFGFNEHKYRIVESICTIRRMDDLKLTPSFIKIDVQGYELHVLKGGENTIRNSLPIIFIGAVRNDQHEFLRQFGYHHFVYHPSSGSLYETSGNEPNSFFIPAGKIQAIVTSSKT
jgi:FkbM family methyltransferase